MVKSLRTHLTHPWFSIPGNPFKSGLQLGKEIACILGVKYYGKVTSVTSYINQVMNGKKSASSELLDAIEKAIQSKTGNRETAKELYSRFLELTVKKQDQPNILKGIEVLFTTERLRNMALAILESECRDTATIINFVQFVEKCPKVLSLKTCRALFEDWQSANQNGLA